MFVDNNGKITLFYPTLSLYNHKCNWTKNIDLNAYDSTITYENNNIVLFFLNLTVKKFDLKRLKLKVVLVRAVSLVKKKSVQK